MNTQTVRSTRKPFFATAVLAAAAFAALPGPAAAGMVSSGGGDFSVVPLYRAFVFGGIDRDGDGGFAFDDINGIDYASNIAPLPLAAVNATVSADGATFNGIGQSAWSGFYAGRNYAQISVSNAQAVQGYYQVAGQGSATSVRFYTPQAQADHATFTWHVSGSSSNTAGIGLNTGRLDFGASTDTSVNWNSLFDDPQNKLDSITEFGPGSYTYTLPIADLGTAINLYYWSSAFAQVNSGQAAQGSNFTMTADYWNTFLLENVQLYDAGNNAITEWTMDDLNLGMTVFDQNGRIDAILPPPAIPEPGTYALMVAGLGFVAWAARRRPAARRA